MGGLAGWIPREVLGERNRSLDVAALRGLVAAREQDDELAVPLREVDAVAVTDVDLQFGHALAQDAMRTRVSMHEPIDADLDAGAGHVVPQAVDPVPVDGRHPDAPWTTVSYGLQLSSDPWRAGAPVTSALVAFTRPSAADGK